MTLRLITAPEVDPVTLDQVKGQCRVSHALEDSLLTMFTKAAVEHGENLTNRQFVEAEYELVLDGFPDEEIELPRPPLQSVEAITYLDPDGVLQTLSSELYVVEPHGLVGRILPAYGESWPATRSTSGAVKVRFKTGWPTAEVGEPPVVTATTPGSIRTWILIRVAGLYEQREAFVQGSREALTEMPRSFVDGLLDRWIVPEGGA